MNTNNDVVGNYGEIDNLTYTYDPTNLNRIQTITDGTTAAHTAKGFRYKGYNSGDYVYDDNGNLVKDPNKDISNIVYNYLNLPELIEFTFGSSANQARIQFVYDASGAKLRKISKSLYQGQVVAGSEKIIDYVGGYEYEGTNNPQNSLPSRIHHTEGALTKEANSNVFQYEYVLRDHLGNTRVTFKDKDNNGTIDYSNVDASINEVSQINHFYPFGLNMEGNWNGASGANKYTYNGKELNSDFGLDWLDYGARFYTADAPRWVNVDPLSEKMYSHSPYNFCYNNPMRFIDPDGMAPNDNILYVLRLSGADDATMQEAMKKLNGFISKADLKVQILEVNDPKKFDATKIDKTDAIAVIGGTKTEVSSYIRSNLTAVISSTFYEHLGSKAEDGYLGSSEGRNPETTDGWGRNGWSFVTAITTKMISTESSKNGVVSSHNVMESLQMKSASDVVALSTLHGMGHLSPKIGQFQSGALRHTYGTFMADGTDLGASLKAQGGDINKLIDATKTKNPEIIQSLQTRFSSNEAKLNYNPNQ